MPSRLFVTDAPVPIYEFNPTEVISATEPSVIYIRARMDVETSGRVTSELFTMGKGEDRGLEAHVGANQTALLVHNIVRWDGPLFYRTDANDAVMLDGHGRPLLIPCTPESIRTLDPNDPFIANVLEEIATRNKKRESPKAGSPTASGSMSAGAVDSTASPANDASPTSPLANGASRSSLQSAVDGRLNRSVDSILTT